MTFAERLTELRIENGYSTRVAFAEKIGEAFSDGIDSFVEGV